MEALTVDLWTFDVGVSVDSPAAYAREMTRRVGQSWDDGADVVVFPEYAWMGLECFVKGKDKLAGVAKVFWGDVWPGIVKELSREGKAAVLGSVPAIETDGVHNRVPILCEGRSIFQDKLNLTPWERHMGRGNVLHLWSLKGTTLAVIVCLDVEVPELSVALRGQGLDCLLVPSATENVLGVERVGRCANARAVELCCHVGVSQLVGRANSELVDENVGRLGWFSPSQTPWQNRDRETVSSLHESGFHVLRGTVDTGALARSRSRRAETNPALLTPGGILVQHA
jgi:predicted amidohydrolase